MYTEGLRDGLHGIVSGQIRNRHARGRIISIVCAVMIERQRHQAPLRAGDFLKRLVGGKGEVNAGYSCFATQRIQLGADADK
jgi:hypothetical protein